MSEPVSRALALLLGERVHSLSPIAGGDINRAYRATTGSGRVLFVKTREHAPPGMYAREAEGLSWLARARAVALPEVVAVSEQMLVLAFVPRGQKARDFDEQLGRALARLHRAHAPTFGLAHDNFIAYLPQENTPHDSFAAFYRERRLRPLVRQARERAHIDRTLEASFERLYPRLDQLCGPEEPPARLHGDLWSGNVYVDPRGAPMLVDPAVYGGHRELDLAMLQLFGSPSARFFSAYDELYPRAPGHRDRVALFQLYPLLVHVHLFGGSYVRQLGEALARYL